MLKNSRTANVWGKAWGFEVLALSPRALLQEMKENPPSSKALWLVTLNFEMVARSKDL